MFELGVALYMTIYDDDQVREPRGFTRVPPIVKRQGYYAVLEE
jgi:hypothetical protein